MTLLAGMSAPRLARFAVVLVVFAFLAFVAARDAAIAAFRATAPQYVVGMGVKDGKVLAKVYMAKLAATQLKKPLADSERQDLVASLSDMPLDRSVLRTLALDSQIRRDDKRARLLMMLASRVSRRDVATQLWLVNDAVARRDLTGVLTHYDAALSIRNQTYEILLPTMIQALVHPQFRAQVVPLMKAERPWVESFLSYAVDHAPTIAPTATLIEEAGDLPNEKKLRPVFSHVLARLVNEGRVREGRAFAINVLGADPEVLKDSGMTEETVIGDFAPLTWGLTEGADLSAYLNDDGQIEIRVTTDIWQPATSRVFEGTAGPYEIAFSSISPRGAAAATSRITGYCLRPGERRVVFQRDFAALANANTWRNQFRLPADCAGLQVDMLAKSERLGSEAVLIIRDFELARTGD